MIVEQQRLKNTIVTHV